MSARLRRVLLLVLALALVVAVQYRRHHATPTSQPPH